MTSLRGAVVINHQVFHTASTNPDASLVTKDAIEHALHYNNRDGKFEGLGDFDREPTKQDLYLESMKIADAMSIENALEYGARVGRFENRNPELPMQPGEYSGGCWDARGLVDIEQVRDEILDSGSNFVKTVVSVPREWASELNLETKAQWQSLIRGTWGECMHEWGVMPDENARWCAFFHTDNAVNIHVHVISWSSDGQYFNGEQQIPYKAIEPSSEIVRREIFKDISLSRSITKEYLREAILMRTRELLGAYVSPDMVARLDALATKAGEQRVLPAVRLSEKSLEDLQLELARMLPPSGVGRLSFSSASAEGKEKAREIILHLREQDSDLDKLFVRWSTTGEIGADILGLPDNYRTSYITQNEADITKRVSNIVIKDAGYKHGQPWMRDPELSQAKNELILNISNAIPQEEINKLGGRFAKNPDIKSSTFTAVAWKAIESDPKLEEQIGRYVQSVEQYATSHAGRTLPKEQLDRLSSRARNDIARSTGVVVSQKALERSLIYAHRANDRAAIHALYTTLQKTSTQVKNVADWETVREVQQNLKDIKKSMRRGKINEAALARTVATVLQTPSLENSLRLSAKLISKESNGDISEVAAYKSLLRDEKNLISDKIVEICERMETQSHANLLSNTLSLLQCALSSSQTASQSPSKGIKFRTKLRHANNLSKEHSQYREQSMSIAR